MAENPRISGIDWQGLRKGDLVPHDHVKEFFFSIFPDEEWNDFSMVRVIDKLMKLRETINRPLVIKSINKDKSLQVLTDKEAVDDSAQQANAGIKKHRKHTRRLFTHINRENLDPSKQRDLETKQIHHAFIASAADGARKESLQLQRFFSSTISSRSYERMMNLFSFQLTLF